MPLSALNKARTCVNTEEPVPFAFRCQLIKLN